MSETGDDLAPVPIPAVVVLLSATSALDHATVSGLKQAGLRPRSFQDPELALVAATEERPALIVLDAENRELKIHSFMAALSAACRESLPPVVVLLGDQSTAEPVLERQCGVDHFLSRPFAEATLGALCRALAGTGSFGGGTCPRPQDESSPTLRVRHSARFSVRPLYGETVAYVQTTFEETRHGTPIDTPTLGVLAERTHTALLQSNSLLLRALEPYTRFDLAHHCVNVAVIAGKVAVALGFSLAETQRVIQAGLIHDIGMTRVPERVLYKEGSLSELERQEMQLHPVHASGILSSLGDEWEWMRVAVTQEHERLKGQGYPEGLTGDAIDEIAQVLGIADVFEALSQVRSYRSPFTLYEALEKVTTMTDEYFAARLVDALASEISVFPVDSYVQLSTGEIGRVVTVNSGNLMRPTLDVLWDADWKPLAESKRIDLEAHPEIAIVRPLHEAAVPIT